jgi:hypothetical protein
MRTTTSLLLAALAALPGCACDTVPADAVQDCSATQVLPDAVATDILFVIDDSGSMSEEQANLRDNLGAFIDALIASPVENDFRIGVTSTSVEEFGATATTGQSYPCAGRGCTPSVPFPDGALLAVRQDAGGNGIAGSLDYDRTLYPSLSGFRGARVLGKGDGSAAALAALARDFKANVQLGTTGSGREQPFRAARLALTDRLLDVNAGFLRPGARLAVIIVTDEDDCSGPVSAAIADNASCETAAHKADPTLLTAPAEFASFLFGPIDGELRDVAVGVIAGFDPTTLAPAMCSNPAAGVAWDKGDRFATLLGDVGAARMRLGSICDASFADTLRGFAEILMPSSLPLQGAPADWRMLAVTLTKADGTQLPCPVAAEETAGVGAAGAIYSPPRFGRPAQLTFQNQCALALNDRIDVRIVCVH